MLTPETKELVLVVLGHKDTPGLRGKLSLVGVHATHAYRLAGLRYSLGLTLWLNALIPVHAYGPWVRPTVTFPIGGHVNVLHDDKKT